MEAPDHRFYCSFTVFLWFYHIMKKSRISWKIHAKMESKSDPKIDVWAIRGPTFEVLGRFLRGLIFDEFSIGKKSAKNPTFGDRGSATGAPTGI